jgi:hypothetical protein
LNQLADRIGNCHEKTLVEIGCYLGVSTIVWAERFLHVVAVDPFEPGYDDGDLCSRKNGEAIYRKFLENIAPYSNVNHELRHSTAPELSDIRAEVVYIDGNHRRESVVEDIQTWAPRVDIVAGHDYNRKSVKEAVDRWLHPPNVLFADNSWLCYQ